MKKKYLIHVIWAVAVIAAFAGGMYYAKASASSASAARGANFAGARGGAGARSGAGGGFVAGQILSEDAQSLTIQLANGNSEVVFYSTSTPIIKPTPASANDLVVGTNVMVGGTANSDGSLTAQSIQIRIADMPGFGPGGGRRGSATSTSGQ